MIVTGFVIGVVGYMVVVPVVRTKDRVPFRIQNILLPGALLVVSGLVLVELIAII